MKIGVISDTHGNKASMNKAVTLAGTVDFWLHAGDYSSDADYLAEMTGLPVTAVAGNCDGLTDSKIDEFIAAGGKTIWLTHGHRYQAKARSSELAWWGRQYEADVIIYGHSHIADISWVDDILLFNPGSTYHPRGGGEKSFGILTIDGGRIDAEIISLAFQDTSGRKRN